MLRFILKGLVGMALLGVISLVVVSLIVIPDLPDIDTLRDIRMQVPLRVYSGDGSLIAEFGEMRRIPVTTAEIPEQFINAFIAAEDDRFYEHPGVDWQGILRAAINLALTGEKSQGGSTITMLVARNFFLSREKLFSRKITEIFLALKIEQALSKNEILDLFLNKIYLGHRAYGIGAAAQVYYGVGVNELTLPQMAMIAGLPKAPSTTNPVTSPERAKIRRSYVLGRMLDTGYITQTEFDMAIDSPVTASLHRSAVELEAPYVAEMVRRDLVERYGDEATTAGFRVYTTIRDRNQAAANHALRTAVLEYDVRHGYRGPESHTELDTLSEDQHKELLETFPVIANLYPALVTEVRDKSITAYLTGIGPIDIEWDGLQWARKYLSENSMGPVPATASDILKAGDIIRIIEDNNGQWKLSQLPSVEGALISLSSRDGSILALTGGFDFYRSSFNRVTQAKRQPGSGFKPFIYSAALEEGFTTASIINDAPLVREFAGVEEAWRPENYSGRYYGPTRLREALIHSRNIVSIRVLDAIGVDKALKHIEKFGFDISQLPPSLSLALGSGEVTPWQMAAAYSVFSNGGYRIEPHFITRIEGVDGEMIFEANPAIVCDTCEEDMTVPQLDGVALEEITVPVHMDADETVAAEQLAYPAKSKEHYAERTVDPQNIWIMNSITSDVIKRGTAVRARALNRQDLAGKTGTTNEQHDAWFFGYNPEMVTITWVGFDSFRELGINEVGGRAALPMWIDYMRIALAGMPEIGFDQPPGLVTARIDPATGKLASADNPNAIFEVFRSEYVPNETSEERTADRKRVDDDQIPGSLF